MFMFLFCTISAVMVYCILATIYHAEYIRSKVVGKYYDNARAEISKYQNKVSVIKAPFFKIIPNGEILSADYFFNLLLFSFILWVVLLGCAVFALMLPTIFCIVLTIAVLAVILVTRAHNKARKENTNG